MQLTSRPQCCPGCSSEQAQTHVLGWLCSKPPHDSTTGWGLHAQARGRPLHIAAHAAHTEAALQPLRRFWGRSCGGTWRPASGKSRMSSGLGTGSAPSSVRACSPTVYCTLDTRWAWSDPLPALSRGDWSEGQAALLTRASGCRLSGPLLRQQCRRCCLTPPLSCKQAELAPLPMHPKDA